MTSTQLISFARGAPSLDIVDVDGLKAAACRAFDTDPVGATAYGTSVGYLPLRSWIAEKHDVEVDQVLLTNGSLQGDAFLFDHVVRSGDTVIVEKPTYDRTLLSLQNSGAVVHQITLDSDGLRVNELRAALESGLRPKLAHIIPNFQNPAGVTLSTERRIELLQLAVEYDFIVFEDDPYVDIRFRGDPLPSMLSLAPKYGAADHVVRAGSFTKTVCPGVRMGYLIGPKPLITRIANTATNLYISPNMVAGAIVHQFCVAGNFDRSIATVSKALGERSQRLGEALRKHLPAARFTQPDGGYFLWVEFPDAVDAAKVVTEGAARGVAVVKGSDFLLTGGDHALRLAFAAVPVEQIEEGVIRLAAAVEAATVSL